MHIKIFFGLLFFSATCFSQDTIPISKIDTLINFFSKKSLRLYPYNNRSVPFESYNPLYVLINYENGKVKHFEYFRIDSTHYLTYEFFRSDKGSSNDGLRSSGIVKVTDTIIGQSITGVSWVGRRSGNKQTKEIHYFKGLSKEGDWNEYEDSLFNHRYWTGKYTDDKKVGIWSNYIYDPNDDRLIQQIDYDNNSIKKIYSTNIVGQLTIDSISYYLQGRWRNIGCEDANDIRNLSMKCELYSGEFGDDCNSRFGDISYYEFLKNNKFKRQNGETCKKSKNYATTGVWKINMKNENLFLEIRLTNNTKLNYHIIYLDRGGNMVADWK